MPPGASMIVEVDCGAIDEENILDTLASVDGVHAVFTAKGIDGSQAIIIMWRSVDDASKWIESKGFEELLSDCPYRYKIYRVTGHEHGPAHPGHHGHHH